MFHKSTGICNYGYINWKLGQRKHNTSLKMAVIRMVGKNWEDWIHEWKKHIRFCYLKLICVVLWYHNDRETYFGCFPAIVQLQQLNKWSMN